MISTTVKAIGTACTVAAALAVTIVPTAAAKGGDGIRVAGTCSDGSSSKLKVKHDDGRIEAEFEVDQNRNGVAWNVELRRDGRLVFSGVRTTVAPSGSFSVERKIAGGASSAVIRARATRNGEVCTATAKLPARTATTAATKSAAAAPAGAVKLRGDGSVDDNSAGASTVDDHGGDRQRLGRRRLGQQRPRQRRPRARRKRRLSAHSAVPRAAWAGRRRPARGGFRGASIGGFAGCGGHGPNRRETRCEGVPTGFAAAALQQLTRETLPVRKGPSMTYDDALTVGDIDRDGALQETAERAGVTRAGALRTALLGSGALIGGSALLGALPSSALAGSTRATAGDVDILNFALTLEYLEAAFYAEAVKGGKLSGEAVKFAKAVAHDEDAHVKFLKGALGSKAVKTPKFDFKGTTGAQATFLKTAMALEDTGVSAYAGAAPMIADKKTLSAALSVHSVEARHAAWVRDILGKGSNPLPAPAPFDPARSKAQVLKIVTGTGFIVM